MNKYITILNFRTVISLLISIVTLFLCYSYELYFNIDLTLLSIAIIFPLVFNIRGSFRRREKALEHLSQYRSALKTVHYLFLTNPKFTEDDKVEISNILIDISDKVLIHLRSDAYDIKELDESVNRIFEFVNATNDEISSRFKDKIFRFVYDVHESLENLNAIHVHRTPISLKAYCEYFIYIFPIFYTPAILFLIGFDAPIWVASLVVLFSEFMLISLYNIQDQLEYPFDNIGVDDINLDLFKIER